MRRGIGRLRAGGGGFNPTSLFAAGEQGAWYDPSDFSAMWQDSAGTTPVSVTGQPVGFILDKRQGTARGSQLAVQTSTTSGWTASNATLSSDGTLLTVTSSGVSAIADSTFPTVVGQWYEFIGTCAGGTGATRQIRLGSTAGAGDYYNPTGTGSFRAFFKATAVTCFVRLFSGDTGGNTGIYGPLSVTSIGGATGNHAAQSTTTMRALVSSDFGETYDGVDDADATASGGGSTTGFFYCASLNVVGGAASARTLWSDTGTNTGYRVRINASNQFELAAGNGTAYTTVATSGTLTVGTSYVVTAWHDGVNLNVQINKGTVASGVFGAVTAGTAAFTEAKDNGASTSPANVTLYTRIYRQTVPTATQIGLAQTYVGAKAGLTI